MLKNIKVSIRIHVTHKLNVKFLDLKSMHSWSKKFTGYRLILATNLLMYQLERLAMMVDDISKESSDMNLNQLYALCLAVCFVDISSAPVSLPTLY